jgi:hypothetical protein
VKAYSTPSIYTYGWLRALVTVGYILMVVASMYTYVILAIVRLKLGLAVENAHLWALSYGRSTVGASGGAIIRDSCEPETRFLGE